MAEEYTRLRREHQQFVDSDGCDACSNCDMDWPCDTAVVLDLLRDARPFLIHRMTCAARDAVDAACTCGLAEYLRRAEEAGVPHE